MFSLQFLHDPQLMNVICCTMNTVTDEGTAGIACLMWQSHCYNIFQQND
jgi:hypothetical protein